MLSALSPDDGVGNDINVLDGKPIIAHSIRQAKSPSSATRMYRRDPHDRGGMGDVYTRFRKPFDYFEGLKSEDWDPPGPYLQYVRRISSGWPHQRYLADFMALSTVPHRKEIITSGNKRERLSRVHIAVLTLSSENGIRRENLYDKHQLAKYLTRPEIKNNSAGRLFVVEDLSATVIEQLGAKFDIPPGFFREQIDDCVFYDPKNAAVDIPDLASAGESRSYHKLRYVQGRYFETEDSFKRARILAGHFNVLRRVDTDSKEPKYTTRLDSIRTNIGFVRSKASLWTRGNKRDDTAWLGILLVDPSVQEGHPLWAGYGNLEPSPSMHDTAPLRIPPYTSVFENFIHWTIHKDRDDLKAMLADPSLLVSSFYSIVCTEWILVGEYLAALLNTLEWQIENGLPSYEIQTFDDTLKLLLTWRRRLPTYTGYIQATIRKITYRYDTKTSDNKWTVVAQDFDEVLQTLEALRDRADKGLNVAVAVTAREDSKAASRESRAITRVTYLAFVFVPLSFVASFMSMSGDFPVDSYWIYFAVALPLSATSLLLLVFSSHISRLVTRLVKVWSPKNMKESQRRRFKDPAKLV